MDANYIPGLEPFGQGFETVQIIIGIAVLVLGTIGIVLYLRWKLPREDEPLDEGGSREDSGDRA